MELINNWVAGISSATGLQAWALSLFLVVLAALLLDFLQRRLMKRLGAYVAATDNNWDDALFNAAVRPLSLLIWLIGITLAAELVPLFDDSGQLGGGLVQKVRQVGVLFGLSWFLTSFIRNVENNIMANSRQADRPLDQTTVHALGRVLRITVVVTAVLVGLDTLGFNVAGLLAAGGIGGLAIGFAAKDILANFFGGATVFMERPFSIGDWIIISDKGIEGTVENIGWRQTTIRKFDKRPVYVPNAIFTTASVENPSRMTNRRINETIGLRYDDVASVDKITAEVLEMLKSHPAIDQKQTLMVNFDSFGPSSLDFFIYCLTKTTNWVEFHAIKQDVLLKTYRIIEQNGAGIAFPTRTLHLQGEPQLAGLETAAPEKENVQ
ncbi:MAG: mechanosensitive ion channel family protein [Xanthomonadales bacterium]|jgi:MscS family membrane protein|nr:mechanosensitive ion channel family protein [Xanthomonadales bacterium]